MSRTVNLWQYLPPFLKEYKELNTLFSAESPEFQTMAEQLDEMRDDFFIQTASEKGIARYEKILGFRPNISDSLETRRSNVLARWYDGLPYTVNALKKRLSIIQGNNDVDVTIDDNDPFHLFIDTHLETAGQLDQLYYILDTMLPANISYSSRNYVGGTVRLKLNYDLVSSMTGTFTLTNDLDCNVKISGNSFVGMAKSAAAFIYQSK